VDSSAVSARLIGSIFVEKGLITEEQLEHALDVQRETGERLGEILVDRFSVERLDLAGALAEQWAEYERGGAGDELSSPEEPALAPAPVLRAPGAVDPATAGKRPIGEIFVERGLVTASQLEQALEEQRKTGGRLGEILVATGKLSRLELASALADQWATFQKLRPPDEPVETDAATIPGGKIMPTPEVVAPAPVMNGAAAELANRIESLSARVDELASANAGVSAIDQETLASTAAALTDRIDQLEGTLSSRDDHEVAELRTRLDEVLARLDAPDAAVDDWRSELAEVAANLRTRIERVEESSSADRLTEVASRLDGLTERVDSLPQPSEAWRDAIAELTGRLDALPLDSGDWRDAVRELGERLDVLAGGSDDWRSGLAELAARVDAVHDESIAAGSDLFETLRKRVEHVEHDLAGQANVGAVPELGERIEALASRIDGLPAPSEEWRDAIAALETRFESLPAPSEEWREQIAELQARLDAMPQPSDEWRHELAALRERLDSLPAPSEEWRDAFAALETRFESLPAPSEEWREQIAELQARLDAMPQPSDEWRHELAALRERLDSLPAPSEEWRGQIAQLQDRLDAMPQPSEEWRGEVEALRARLESLPMPSDEWRHAVGELQDALGRQAIELQGLTARGDQHGSREVEEQLTERLGTLETTVAELCSLASSADALGARIGAVEERAAAISMHSAQEIELLRRQLGEFQAVQTTAAESVAARIDDVAVRLRGELETAASALARTDAVDALATAVSETSETATALGETVVRLERRLDESGAARTADLAALRARLEDVETRLGHQLAGSEAIGDAHDRIDRVERLIEERSGSEADARRADVDAVRIALTDRVAALEVAQAKRKDVRELASGLHQLERRLDARESVDEAATRAIEKTVRKGLSKLGEQMAEAEESYLEAGRKLHAAIEGLGRAVHAADAHLGESGEQADDVQAGATYVAFAPTLDGYRLVVCSGPAPALGERVVVPSCEGELVVTRVGSSPLPFDARACVYLEQA